MREQLGGYHDLAPLRRSGADFFTKENCDRCNASLEGAARTMSWFTTETICLACSVAEDAIKMRMREKGMDPAKYEGCGYVPNVSG